MARFRYTNIEDPGNPVREGRDIVEVDPVKVEAAFNLIPGVTVEPGSLSLVSLAGDASYGGGFVTGLAPIAASAAGVDLALALDVSTWFQYYFTYDAGSGEFTFVGDDGEVLPVRLEVDFDISADALVTFETHVNGVVEPGAVFVKKGDSSVPNEMSRSGRITLNNGDTVKVVAKTSVAANITFNSYAVLLGIHT